ncbi:MAG: NUDIX hydrolase [Candidatus Nanopelagicales bacterium]
MAAPTRDPIRAAGVVLTRGIGKELEIAVIHRRRQRDWSLPKGKFEPGEHVLEVAVRECVEETGLIPILETPLPTQRYRVDGWPKTVEYWRASVRGGEFAANKEVDRLRWLNPREAVKLLTYPRDGDLVTAAAKYPPTIPFILLRHALAEKRVDWARRTGNGRDDPARGLLERGTWQSRRLVHLLSAYGIRGLHSSDAERCMATLRPSAAAQGVGTRRERAVSEEVFLANPAPGRERTVELFTRPEPIVLCSHRPVLPGQLSAIRAAVGGPSLLQGLTPGAFYVFHRTWVNRADPTVAIVAVEHHDPPHEHQ